MNNGALERAAKKRNPVFRLRSSAASRGDGAMKIVGVDTDVAFTNFVGCLDGRTVTFA